MQSQIFSTRLKRYIPENISNDELFSQLIIDDRPITAKIKNLSEKGLYLHVEDEKIGFAISQ